MKLLLTVLLVVYSAQVVANTVAGTEVNKSKLMQCATFKQDIDRLACFDNLVIQISNGNQTGTNIRKQGKWEIREKVNPVDNAKQISILLDADFGQSSSGENISMVLRCRANLTDMYIVWGDPLNAERVPVVVKLGNENVETELWERSRSLKTSFRDKPTHLLRQMMLHKKAVFQVKLGQDPVTAVFDISGLREILRPIRELCNWTH